MRLKHSSEGMLSVYLDIVVKGARHEQSGVDRVPQDARNAVLVRAPCSLANAEYCLVCLQGRCNMAPGGGAASVWRWLLYAEVSYERESTGFVNARALWRCH